jgi:GT2 family glycosyltransferase
MSVTAVVINFNTGQALHRCVQALVASSVQPRILVIDNASTDGGAEQLRNLYGNQAGLEILVNPANLGFARAVNVAAGHIDSDHLLIINPDCCIHKEALGLMLLAMEEDAAAALAAPCVRDSKGKPEKAALRRFPDPWKSLITFSGLGRLGRWVPFFQGVFVAPGKFPTRTIRAEAVSGSCMLIRRDAFMQVGMMDEAYGLHCEDLDLMYRLQQAGWFCLFVPGALADHEKGVSSRSRPLWVHRQKHMGMARFYRKFQAAGHWLPFRWLVYTGIWLRYLLLWPLVWIRK